MNLPPPPALRRVALRFVSLFIFFPFFHHLHRPLLLLERESNRILVGSSRLPVPFPFHCRFSDFLSVLWTRSRSRGPPIEGFLMRFRLNIEARTTRGILLSVGSTDRQSPGTVLDNFFSTFSTTDAQSNFLAKQIAINEAAFPGIGPVNLKNTGKKTTRPLRVRIPISRPRSSSPARAGREVPGK